MAHKKDSDRLRTRRAADHMRWEIAKEKGLTGEADGAISLLSLRDNFHDKGQVKDQLQTAEEELARDSASKTALNLKDEQEEKK